MNLDLPNLASINSEGWSFRFPRSVTLESILTIGYLWKLDIPNVQNVELRDAFNSIISPVVKSNLFFNY